MSLDAFLRWQPMKRAARAPLKPEMVKAAENNPDIAEHLAKPIEMWKNHLYTVTVTRNEDRVITCLSIKRNDGRAVSDWRHMQQIKDEIAGPDAEAFQLFPARDRIVDAANQIWLWCLPPGMELPVGFPSGAVGTPEEAAEVGAHQREFEAGLGFGKR